jgi:hypothetical protein
MITTITQQGALGVSIKSLRSPVKQKDTEPEV